MMRKKWKGWISQIDSFKNFLPQYYLKMGIVLRKRHDLSNSITYLNKALDFSSNNKYIIAEMLNSNNFFHIYSYSLQAHLINMIL